MRLPVLILSILFSIYSSGANASSREDEWDITKVSTHQQRINTMEQKPSDDTSITALFVEIIGKGELMEESIKNLISPEDFEKISNKGWEAEQNGDYDLALACIRLSAIGGLMVDQQKLAMHYLNEKDYKNASKWYIRAALNKNPDVLADLYEIDKTNQIIPYVNEKHSQTAEDILAMFWEKHI